MTDQNTPSDPVSVKETLEAPSLLKMPKKEVAAQILKDWDASHQHLHDIGEQWKINLAVTAGYMDAQLVKVQDRQEAQIPYGSTPSSWGMNKAMRLRERLSATLFADPPIPEATSSSDEDEDIDAAEVATRVLQDQTSENQLDYGLRCMETFDIASDYGSGFQHIYVDQQGGGWRPQQIVAHPLATDAENPLLEEEMLRSEVPYQDFILRYETKSGHITDDEAEAAKQWLPRLKLDDLTGRQVRFLPFTARDIWDAEGVMVGAMVTLGELRRLFPKELDKLEDDELEALTATRPEGAKDLLAPNLRDRLGHQTGENALVFVLSRYHVQSPVYPKGAYLIACGADTLLHRGDWWDEEHQEPLDLPVTQFKQYFKHGNPYGVGLMERLGPAQKIRSLMLASFLRHLDRFGSRKTFVPLTSNLRPEQLQAEDRTVLPISPGGMPVNEDVPDYPVVAEKMYAMTGAEMDDESGLQQTAQGVASPSVQSGKHADRIIQQVNVGLSGLREHTERAYVRGCRIMLQQMRWRFTVPQQIKFLGEDGDYKVQRWSNTDLGSTRDIRLQRGSFTQLSPGVKADLARQLYGDQVLDPQAYAGIVSRTIGPAIALRDDPHRQRVRRQIYHWQKGPPEGWQAPQPPIDPQTGQPQVDPQTGQPMPPPPDPILAGMFAPLPTDATPKVAAVREFELGRSIAGSKFSRWPEPWRAGMLGAYEAARQAAGIVTVQEQQQAQQQQMQAQQQAQQQAAQAGQQAEQGKAQAKQQDAAVKGQAAQMNAQTEREKIAGGLQKAQMEAQARLQQAQMALEGEKLDVEAALASGVTA